MANNCTDSSNAAYQTYWLDYFVSNGYLTSSVNDYAPYGRCTRSLLWITYLINIIHFCLLSSGFLYISNRHQLKNGCLCSVVNWFLAFIFLVASIVLFILLNVNTNLFTIFIIVFQSSTLMILWISIFMIVIFTFTIEHRLQKWLFGFTIILLLLHIGCIITQALITFHCLFNLKFISSTLDYSSWSAIAAAAGTVISTVLLDCIFIWPQGRRVSSRVNPVPTVDLGESRATSPIDSVILRDFHRNPEAAAHQVYSNNSKTRHFRILPKNEQPNGIRKNVFQLRHVEDKNKKHSIPKESET